MINEDEMPTSLVERASMLENLLIARATGDLTASNPIYELLRGEFMADQTLGQAPLIPRHSGNAPRPYSVGGRPLPPRSRDALPHIPPGPPNSTIRSGHSIRRCRHLRTPRWNRCRRNAPHELRQHDLPRWAPGSRRKRRAARFHVTPPQSSARCRDGSGRSL
jgi:hypothetical protein